MRLSAAAGAYPESNIVDIWNLRFKIRITKNVVKVITSHGLRTWEYCEENLSLKGYVNPTSDCLQLPERASRNLSEKNGFTVTELTVTYSTTLLLAKNAIYGPHRQINNHCFVLSDGSFSTQGTEVHTRMWLCKHTSLT